MATTVLLNLLQRPITSCIPLWLDPSILDSVVTDAARILRGLSALLVSDPTLHMFALQQVINVLCDVLDSVLSSEVDGRPIPHHFESVRG